MILNRASAAAAAEGTQTAAATTALSRDTCYAILLCLCKRSRVALSFVLEALSRRRATNQRFVLLVVAVAVAVVSAVVVLKLLKAATVAMLGLMSSLNSRDISSCGCGCCCGCGPSHNSSSDTQRLLQKTDGKIILELQP